MEQIVVGFDGSKPALEALRWAAREAEVRGAEVRVVQGWMEPLYGDAAWIDVVAAIEQMRADAEADLAAAVAEVAAAHPGVTFSTELSDEMPADALIAASGPASLVVAGARGRGGFNRLLLGSVSQHVATAAATTVVVVRGPGDPDGPVVVGIDGSTASRFALRWAADEARRRDRALHVVLAWSYLAPVGEHGSELFRAGYTGTDARRALDAIVADVLADRSDLDVRREAVCGLPATVLVERSADASLLVLGPRSEHMRSHLHLGSVTVRVLHHASCPVAVVRPPAGEATS